MGRILFCNYEYPPLGGGGGVINALLAEELARHHDVTVLTSQGLGLPRENVEEGVRVLRVPVLFRRRQAAANLASLFAYIPMGIRSGKQLLRRESFDVINTHFALPSGPVGYALARCAGIPNILSVHGGDLYDPSKWTSPHRHALLRAWVRRLLRRADRVVGQSRNTVENVGRYFAPDVSPLRIPLGIKRPVFARASRADYGLSDAQMLLVTVGRLVARKSVDQLIRLMADLKAGNTQLLVIGSGPQETALRELATVLDVANNVRFLGQVSEAEKFGVLGMSDIFVSTSQHEGFGLVYLEAMACGLPVMCYDFGGQTDFLSDGETGHVVPLNDLVLFTQRCRALIGDLDRRARMRETNLSRVEEYFIERCAAQYEAVFDAVIAERKGARLGYAARP